MTIENTITDTEYETSLTTPAEEAVVEETTEESIEPDAKTEVDWEARVKELEAQAKRTNDTRAKEGRSRQSAKDQERDLVLANLAAKVDALVTRTSSGEVEELTADLAKISEATAETQAGNAWEETFQKYDDKLASIITDADGNLRIDGNSDEVKAQVQRWREAKAAEDQFTITDVIFAMQGLVQASDQAKAVAATAETERKASKTREIKAGVNDLSIASPAAGSGTGKNWEQVQTASNVNEISDDDYARLVAGK